VSRLRPDASSDREWRQQAACRDHPTERFTGPASRSDTAAALATCDTCTVRTACLTTALTHEDTADVGIWGGTTVHTRRRIRAGEITIDDALDARTRRPPPPQPTLAVARTSPGTYASADGRTVIFRIHGDPPWMLMIDHRCIARAPTLRDARRLAWTRQQDPPPHAGIARHA
jgi:hypothetical protein